MASTYDYSTGQIKTDFHFIVWDEKCKGSGLPCYAGSGRCTEACRHFKGSLHPWSYQSLFRHLDNSYVMCGCPGKKDSDTDDIRLAWHIFCKNLKDEALCALDS